MKNKIIQQKRASLFVLLLTLTGMTNTLAQEFTVDKLKYSIIDNGSDVELIGFVDNNKVEGNLYIPNKISWNGKEYHVTQISFSAFRQVRYLSGE